MSVLPKTFNLLRWFSLLSLIAIASVAVFLALTLSHFITEEAIEREAILTYQFIRSVTQSEDYHAQFGGKLSVPELLDERVNPVALGVDRKVALEARAEFIDHIRLLPDVLLANVFGKDRTVIWSTNPVLIGHVSRNNEELEEAFRSKVMVAHGHIGKEHNKGEQMFLGEPEAFYIENYVPIVDAHGAVVAVVEIYKEPKSVIPTLRKGYQLIWGATATAGLIIYFPLFWMVRRASRLLAQQQQRLVDSKTLVAMGEMSAAVAHGLRNPLAAIRSSAELAMDTQSETIRKNARDIISQVDRLSRWLRELLVFSRPVSCDDEAVDVVRVLDESVRAFSQQCEKAGVRVDWQPEQALAPTVVGNGALMGQVFNSILSNALEAMPQGGVIRIFVDVDFSGRRVTVTIGDTGVGMSEKQLAMAFKPFFTTKCHGLGVGLALVKRIMDRFGGSVRLSSRESAGTDVQLEFCMSG